MSKPIIWALFDDANCCYKKAIEKYFDNQFTVYSIGINDHNFCIEDKYIYKKIDLSINNPDLISSLKKLPKPDIILASPPCESWSIADCAGKMLRSIKDETWIIKNKDYYDNYNLTASKCKKRYFLQKEMSRIVGEATASGTMYIIEYFKPKVFIVENPATSKIWEYFKNHWCVNGYFNNTYYAAYDNSFSLKPTTFLSNLKFNLKDEKVEGNKGHMLFSRYNDRSNIPLNLIAEIITQVKDYLENQDETRDFK